MIPFLFTVKNWLKGIVQQKNKIISLLLYDSLFFRVNDGRIFIFIFIPRELKQEHDPTNRKVQPLSTLADIEKQCLAVSLTKRKRPSECARFPANITLVLSATLEMARDRVLKNIFLSHGHEAQLSLRLLQPRSTSHIEWECQAVGGVPPEGQRAHLEARYLYSCCVCFSAQIEQEIPDHLP